MILTVTPNPAIDLTYTVAGLSEGESHRVSPARMRPGGKGVNVARVAHQLGHPVMAVVPLGGDAAREFEAGLVSDGIPHRVVPVAAATRRSIAIVDTGKNLTTVLNETGGRRSSAEWAAIERCVHELLPSASCLVGSGSLPPEAPVSFYSRLVELAQALGVPSVIDASGAGILAAADSGADVLKPNRQELQDATGEADPLAGARLLIDRGAGLVLVSLGEAGMIAVAAADPDHPIRAHLPEPLIGNPTGAGDAAVAAIAVTLASGSHDPLEILLRATAWSAAAVLMPLAGEISPDYAELENRLIVDRP